MATQKKKSPEVEQQTSQSLVRILGREEIADLVREEPAINSQMFSQYVRALMQNWRQGTVKTKDRSEVAFSNKKPWKQKGTGRARAGSRRSPLWRKGGVTFGPQPRVKKLKISHKIKRDVLGALWWDRLKNGNIVLLDWAITDEKPKTANAVKALKEAQLYGKKMVLFVAPHDYRTHASFNNIRNVKMLLFDQPNACILADGECWVILQKDMEQFKKMVSSWT